MLAVAGMIASAPLAAASATAAVSRVSRGDPFAGCAAPPGGGTVYRGAEVGASLAVDPHRPAALVAVYEQDPLSTSGALGAVAAASGDGGRTWTRTPLPFTGCAPGGAKYSRTHEPVVSVGPDGTDYALSLSYDADTSRSAVLVVTSTDRGRRWSPVRVVASYPSGSLHSIYKTAWVTADPRTRVPRTKCGRTSDQSVRTSLSRRCSATHDGGRTWTRPRPIAATGRDRQADTNQIVVDAAHHRICDVYPFFYCVSYSLPKMAFVVSTVGGRTWSGQHVINSLLGSLTVTAPGGAPVRPAYGPVETIDHLSRGVPGQPHWHRQHD